MSAGTLDRAQGTPRTKAKRRKYQYPGTPTTCDGAEAVVWVETHICQARQI